MSKNLDLENGQTYSMSDGYTNKEALGINDNWFGYDAGCNLSIGGNLVNTGTISIDTADSNTLVKDYGAAGGSVVTIAGTLINRGTILIGNEDLDSLGDEVPSDSGTSVIADAFIDTGSLNLVGGAAVQAALIVGSAAPTVLNSSITLYGDALLQFGSGAITGIGSNGSLTLEAATGPDLAGIGGNQGGGTTLQAVPRIVNASAGASALQLTHNAGYLDLEYEVSLSTGAGVDFTNSGTLDLDATQFGSVFGAAMSVGGNLVNTGKISIDTADLGGAGGGGQLTVAQTLTNDGELDIGNQNLGAGAKGNPGTSVTVAALSNSTKGQVAIEGGGKGVAQMTATGSSVNNGAILVARSATSTFAALQNAGRISIQRGSVIVGGALMGGGVISIADGSLAVNSSVSSAIAIDFSTKRVSAVLDIGDLRKFSASVSGFSVGETIDVVGINATSVNYYNGVLTLDQGMKNVGSLKISGSYSTSSFSLQSDNNGGTDIGVVSTTAQPTADVRGLIEAMARFGVAGSLAPSPNHLLSTLSPTIQLGINHHFAA